MTRRTPRQPPTRQDLPAHNRWSPRRAISRQPRSAADTNAAPRCATIKIVYEVTSDSPDGRHGRRLKATFFGSWSVAPTGAPFGAQSSLLKSDSGATDFCIFPIGTNRT